MDNYKAIQLEKEIKGISFNQFKIIELINNGKSAAVFKAEKEGKTFAVKIFDNELVERFGHEIQTKRIEQEIALKKHEIKGLVKIFEGGKEIIANQYYYYLVMEYIEGKNLLQFIQSENYDIKFILKVLNSLVNTTNELLNQKKIAHRDIKPENIMVNMNNDIILMDLGVLKLIGAKSFSDKEEKSFVGTLRYAAPEFLLREEQDSHDGWKALNLYQIGATLHDLITKKELFSDKTPYSNLVIAIKDDVPPIDDINFPFALQQLIRDMLGKNWKKRLQLISSERIQEVLNLKTNLNPLDKSIDEVLKKRIGHQVKFDELEKLRRTNEELRKKQIEVAQTLNKVVENSFVFLREKGIFNSFNKSKNFNFKKDKNQVDKLVQNYLYELEGDLKSGFIRNLTILVSIKNDTSNYTEINIWGIFPSVFLKINVNTPLRLFVNLSNQMNTHNTIRHNRLNQLPPTYNLKTISIFNGVVNFGQSFETHLTSKILELISKALDNVQGAVTNKLEYYEALAKNRGNNTVHEKRTIDHKDVIIDQL